MIVAGRVILGLGVGLEGGTVPVYVAETVERRIRGNLVSLYQLMIALGEVLGYAVAAMFLRLPGNWRYILGSSLVFSTIMFAGYVIYAIYTISAVANYQQCTACYFCRKALDILCTKEKFSMLSRFGSAFEASIPANPERNSTSWPLRSVRNPVLLLRLLKTGDSLGWTFSRTYTLLHSTPSGG